MYLEEVIAMHECETMTGVSIQEDADALMIHHAVEVASNGMNVHIYPQNTDERALVSVQVESALGKQMCEGVFCSSNSEMNKELTNCQRLMEHGLNICAVLMSRLIYIAP